MTLGGATYFDYTNLGDSCKINTSLPWIMNGEGLASVMWGNTDPMIVQPLWGGGIYEWYMEFQKSKEISLEIKEIP